ncbi:MAG: tryptophan--tRNA ligase [Ktedonobacteraceae bacterium]|nr:tryptophan--tRNA ligase [Ktedonobacteraceae bacterium]
MSIGASQQTQPVTTAHTSAQAKKRVFSGIQPTSGIHLGNYLGAIRNWVAAQTEYDNIFCIVNEHAITLPIDARELRQRTYELAAIYLACGLDTHYCKLFVQSQVRQHAEISWLLTCYTPMGWLNRMTQFKTKAGSNPDSVGAGIYMYPVLMAGDILLYHTHYVPVGEDQRQHVELTRDLALRFNSLYKEQVFTLPEALIQSAGARIMSLQEPTKKMSKSDPDPNATIFLLDDPKAIKKKIARAVTDSQRLVAFDPARPGITNLLTIYQTISGQSQQEIEAEFAGKGYGEFKAVLTERLVDLLVPIQQRFKEYISDMPELERILMQGADEVRPIAEKTLRHVKDVIGLL